MQINVRLGEPLWRAVGRRRVALDWEDAGQATVADVLARLAAEYPAFAAAYAAAPYRLFVDAVPVNTSASSPGPLLSDVQTLYILLPAVGG